MLTNCVKVYVPSTANVKTPAPALAQEMVEAACRLLAVLFGGFTAVPAKGGWMSDSFGLVVEDITIVYSFCDGAALLKGLPRVVALAKDIGDRMGQEAISLEVNGALHFINSTTHMPTLMHMVRAA
jgi:hypothetical protein